MNNKLRNRFWLAVLVIWLAAMAWAGYYSYSHSYFAYLRRYNAHPIDVPYTPGGPFAATNNAPSQFTAPDNQTNANTPPFPKL